MTLTRRLLTCLLTCCALLPGLIAAFSLDSQRVFVSTPVSNWPKRLVGDCMSDVPVTLQPTQSVQDAMSVLYAYGITGAPVVDHDLQVIGVVSNYDFLWEEAFEGSLLPLEKQDTEGHWRVYASAARKICAQTVAEVMSDNQVVTVNPETTMRHAAELMCKTKLHHLPVVDSASNQLVGILTSSDVMKDLLHIVRNLPAGNDSKDEQDDKDDENKGELTP